MSSQSQTRESHKFCTSGHGQCRSFGHIQIPFHAPLKAVKQLSRKKVHIDNGHVGPRASSSSCHVKPLLVPQKIHISPHKPLRPELMRTQALTIPQLCNLLWIHVEAARVDLDTTSESPLQHNANIPCLPHHPRSLPIQWHPLLPAMSNHSLSLIRSSSARKEKRRWKQGI